MSCNSYTLTLLARHSEIFSRALHRIPNHIVTNLSAHLTMLKHLRFASRRLARRLSISCLTYCIYHSSRTRYQVSARESKHKQKKQLLKTLRPGLLSMAGTGTWRPVSALTTAGSFRMADPASSGRNRCLSVPENGAIAPRLCFSRCMRNTPSGDVDRPLVPAMQADSSV